MQCSTAEEKNKLAKTEFGSKTNGFLQELSKIWKLVNRFWPYTAHIFRTKSSRNEISAMLFL